MHRFRLPDGLDREDVAQEARVAFLRAVARWRPERGPFAPFARTCVRNYLVNAIDRAGAHKHQILSHARAMTAPTQPTAISTASPTLPRGTPTPTARSPVATPIPRPWSSPASTSRRCGSRCAR